MPNYLGHADNYIEANPLVTPSHIVPEWYFLPFYAILRAIPSKLGGVIAMFGSIVVLAFLPWLDTSRVRSARLPAACSRFWFWLFVVACIGLGYLGSKPPEGVYVVFARILTALLLRLLPGHPAAARHLRDSRGRCRQSIADAVLTRERAGSGVAAAAGAASSRPSADGASGGNDDDAIRCPFS